ncbi:MAG: endonuclease/exonuclease/phosphatase family protein [Spirochaetota bacterium]
MATGDHAVSTAFHAVSTLLLVLAFSSVLASCSSTGELSDPDAFRIATFNVHYLSLRDDTMDWPGRRDAVARVLEEIDADIVAFQEMETFGGGSFHTENRQLDFVLDRLPEMRAAAVGDPETYPSTQPVLYRASRFEALDQGFFFFSPTPDEIYSRPWHARFPAFASWVRLRDTTSRATFTVYNVHFDAQSPRNRLKSAHLVVNRLISRPYPDDPVIVTGDFNAPSFFPTMRTLLDAGLHRAPTSGSTYHFNRGINLIPGIDHILGSRSIRFDGTTVIRRSYGGRFPSDHYPVVARVALE